MASEVKRKWRVAGYVHPNKKGTGVNVRVFTDKSGGATEDYFYSLDDFTKIDGVNKKSADLLQLVDGAGSEE